MTAEAHTLAGSTPPRPLPTNIEAEQSLLAAILHKNEHYDAVSDALGKEHFFDGLNGEIFEAMGVLIKAGKHADGVTLLGVATPKYLADLGDFTPWDGAVATYAEAIRTVAMAREVITAGHELIEAGHAVRLGDDLPEICASSIATIEEISAGTVGGFSHFSEAADTAIAHAEAARDGERPAGVLTGLSELDRLTGGLPSSPLKKASLTGFHRTTKHNAAKAVSPSSETMKTI